jgi:hypothetical protein
LTINPFASFMATPGFPADDAFAVTPSDTVPFATLARGLYCGGGGDVMLVTKAGNTVLFANLAIGSYIPVRCSQVKASGTTGEKITAII